MTALKMPYSAKSVYQSIVDSLSGLGIPFQFIVTPEASKANLEANGVKSPSANKERMVLFPLDPEVVERHVEVIQLAPPKFIETRSMNTIYPMFGCTSPVIVNYPAAFSYVDYNYKA
jgi:hypothetical protein